MKWPAAPCVIPAQLAPPEGFLEDVQRVADRHYKVLAGEDEDEIFDEDNTLSTSVFPLCAGRGPVTPHIDEMDGEAAGRLVYGWVIKSEGHRLHVEGKTPPEGLELKAGDVYVIEPLVRHWTTAPNWWSELIFAVAVTPPETRTPKKLAEDYFWSVHKALSDHEFAKKKAAADEYASYRGIGSI